MDFVRKYKRKQESTRLPWKVNKHKQQQTKKEPTRRHKKAGIIIFIIISETNLRKNK